MMKTRLDQGWIQKGTKNNFSDIASLLQISESRADVSFFFQKWKYLKNKFINWIQLFAQQMFSVRKNNLSSFTQQQRQASRFFHTYLARLFFFLSASIFRSLLFLRMCARAYFLSNFPPNIAVEERREKIRTTGQASVHCLLANEQIVDVRTFY